MGAKLKTATLGCKVNQYETQLVREGLLGAGFSDAEPDQPADLCIVNTCTITGEGDSKSRQIIRRMNRNNPDARIVVMGCYATREPQEVADLPGVAEVVTDKREIPDLLGRFGVVDIPNGISGLNNRHRAYVKVQDGCLLRCSYCIIPTVRPDMFSRPLQDVLDEVRVLIDNGFSEVILTGIHLGHYGVDFNQGKPKRDWVRLSHLVRAICKLSPTVRVRLSSIEATEVTRELIEVMKDFSSQVCPHLHVCLQSGSDRILRGMKRRWTRRHIIDRCQLVKSELHLPAFTTDVIVGFPGETEDDFADTIDACRQIGFSKIHMFPFSPRKGTPAAGMEEQISKKIKSERGARIAALEKDLKREYFQNLVGEELQLLVEKVNDNKTVTGTSCRYATVNAIAPNASENELITVKIETAGDTLSGRAIES
ncbi:tRNA (N(6)-L-threonylcarbamoyladenosine(37)-C(2))-methylthiotransferase MtaB [Mariniblastus sp.]|nr:tRNA (N(6)-L-threonylcarbamoyladenosine(37)-C(2))-methylthiotransferase MtaB [Mariniblastus sp.]MDA7922909.1 tRNA (N(6)-L-threonylcarbamoyladenosine(37)-C(2))-methylthiotransferase MtaB [bacterium]MDA7924101.1 tRNA (N(6)-L-threonylcarbamoyladenosine(37)-C(2))-methylthiotransferase MtaB [Mariniblastus sp.]MDB4380816.1 tRNA (N(6)-L-threonylcarbamoyladenosine(37)-C(2))-methylthiotransferase MtaB [Mariniblastus sp.]MDB4458603.1 tRNA (N(6)-L-threonylcarbamoyladenosine(37)-C(2))-methylthiotransfer